MARVKSYNEVLDQRARIMGLMATSRAPYASRLRRQEIVDAASDKYLQNMRRQIAKRDHMPVNMTSVTGADRDIQFTHRAYMGLNGG